MPDLNTNYTITQTGGANVNEAFEKINTSIAKTSNSVQTLTKKTGDYNMVGMNTARLFSDAGYAAQSFSFGVMSIGNNISPLVESLQRARSAGQSWKDILVSTFTGTSGILVGINILVSAITAFSIATRSAKTEVDTFGNSLKAVLELNDPLNGKKFQADAETLKAAIPIIDAQIKKYGDLDNARRIAVGQKTGVSSQALDSRLFTQQLTAEEQKELETNQKMLETFKQMKVEYESRLKVAKELADLGFKQKESTTKTAKNKTTPITADFFDIVSATWDDYVKDIQRKNFEVAQKDVEENLAGMIETSNARKKYFKDLETFRVQGIQNSFDREIALARKNADEQSSIYTELLLKNQISYAEFANIKDLIEQEFERKRTQAEMQRYNLMLSDIGSIGNALQSAFSKSGDDFIGKLNQALQIALQIAKAINAQEMGIGSWLGVVASIIPGFGFMRGLFGSQVSSPTNTGTQVHNYTIKIGDQQFAKMVVTGQNTATQLRYN